MNKEQIVREIINRHQEAVDYLDKIPRDIVSIVFDNEYTNNISILCDNLQLEILGSSLNYEVGYYMYDMDFGRKNTESIVGFNIGNVDEFIDYLKSKQYL